MIVCDHMMFKFFIVIFNVFSLVLFFKVCFFLLQYALKLQLTSMSKLEAYLFSLDISKRRAGVRSHETPFQFCNWTSV